MTHGSVRLAYLLTMVVVPVLAAVQPHEIGIRRCTHRTPNAECLRGCCHVMHSDQLEAIEYRRKRARQSLCHADVSVQPVDEALARRADHHRRPKPMEERSSDRHRRSGGRHRGTAYPRRHICRPRPLRHVPRAAGMICALRPGQGRRDRIAQQGFLYDCGREDSFSPATTCRSIRSALSKRPKPAIATSRRPTSSISRSSLSKAGATRGERFGPCTRQLPEQRPWQED